MLVATGTVELLAAVVLLIGVGVHAHGPGDVHRLQARMGEQLVPGGMP